MHEIPRPQGSLTTLVSELVGDTVVALCRDRTPGVVWVRIASRLHCVGGAMKTLPVGAQFAAAGVIDPPGSVRAVELELIGRDRYSARVYRDGWLLILPPGSGADKQRVTFHYETGESVESELPPAACLVDSGGTSYAPLPKT
jgi:hypothetical protein